MKKITKYLAILVMPAIIFSMNTGTAFAKKKTDADDQEKQQQLEEKEWAKLTVAEFKQKQEERIENFKRRMGGGVAAESLDADEEAKAVAAVNNFIKVYNEAKDEGKFATETRQKVMKAGWKASRLIFTNKHDDEDMQAMFDRIEERVKAGVAEGSITQTLADGLLGTDNDADSVNTLAGVKKYYEGHSDMKPKELRAFMKDRVAALSLSIANNRHDTNGLQRVDLEKDDPLNVAQAQLKEDYGSCMLKKPDIADDVSRSIASVSDVKKDKSTDGAYSEEDRTAVQTAIQAARDKMKAAGCTVTED